MGNTLYVSNSATNGYGVGSDANTYTQALSKGTPFLTVTRAINAASNGDTVHLNDGTYVEAAYLNPAASALTIEAEHDYQAIIQNGKTTDARVVHLLAAATGITFRTVVLDASKGGQTYCVTTDSGSQVPAITFVGTKFVGWTTYALRVYDVLSFTMDGGWQIVAGAAIVNNAAGIYLNPQAQTTNVYTIQNGSVSAPAVTVAGFAGIQFFTAIAGSTVNIAGNSVTIGATPNVGTWYGISLGGGATAFNVTANVVTLAFPQVATAGGIALYLPLHSSLATGAAVFRGNVLTGPKGSATGAVGKGIQIGSDTSGSAPSNVNSIAGVVLRQNVINGFNHGVFCGWVNGCVAWGNTTANNVLGCVDKHTNSGANKPNLWSGNVVSLLDGTDGALRCKASNGTVYANNLVLLDPTGATSPALYADQDQTGGGTYVNTTNAVYRNNVVYGTAPLAAVVVVNDWSTATFANNDYFSTAGLRAGAWQYQGNSYGSLAAWQAAYEPSALGVDPQFREPAAGDYRISGSSPLVKAGSAPSGVVPLDLKGKPYWNPPDVGPYAVWPGDLLATRSVQRPFSDLLTNGR